MISKSNILLLFLFSYQTPSTTGDGSHPEKYSKQRTIYKAPTTNTVPSASDYPASSFRSSIPIASPIATLSEVFNTTTSPSEYEYDDDMTKSPSEYYDYYSYIPTISPVTTTSPSKYEDEPSDIPTISPITTTSPSKYENSPDDDESEDCDSSESDSSESDSSESDSSESDSSESDSSESDSSESDSSESDSSESDSSESSSSDSNSSESDSSESDSSESDSSESDSSESNSSEDNENSEDSNSYEDDDVSCNPDETGLKSYDKCTKFYLCVAGVVKGDPIPCAEGTLFDEKLQFCNWKKDVICPCKCDCEPSCKPHENHLKAFNACRQYYSCSDGKSDGKIRTVPDDSLLFDESIQSFNRKEDVKCHVKACSPTVAPVMSPLEKPCCPKGFTGLRPFDDCQKYFHCVNGVETGDVLDCPRNKLFDARTMTCMRKKNVECVEEDMCERRSLRG